MPTIRLTAFGGMQPRTGKTLLPNEAAIRAENVKLQSGQLVPFNKARIVYTPGKPMPAKTIYRARDGLNSAGWFTWPFDVDVCRAPLPVEVESRYYWTGDTEPRYAKHSEAISGGFNNYPYVSFALGIPNPQDKPVATPTGGASASVVTRFYAYTFYSANNEESGPGPISASVSGKVDALWSITGMSAFPINSGAMTGVHSAGVTTATCGAPHWLRQFDPVMLSGVPAIVSEIISPTIFKAVGNFAAATAWARATNWNIGGMKRRLYRTTGTSGSWQLVNDNVGITYSDTLTDSQILGDELISDGWEPPDPRMLGICVHSSGAMCGFFGNQLCFSEPLQPHAWPKAYRLAVDFPIVGIAPFGSSIAAATTGTPYVATGVEPVSMTREPITGMYPCMSKRSVISVGDGVLYSSNHGLIFIGASGVRVFTENFYTRDEWLKLAPESMICEYTNGIVYCSYLTKLGETEILSFDGPIHTALGIECFELYADQATTDLYLSGSDGIYLFDPAEQSYPMTAMWRSKEFVFPTPCNLGAAKVDFKLAIDPAALVQLIAHRAELTAKNEAMLALGGFFGAMNYTGYNVVAVNGSAAYYVPELPPTNEIQFILRSGDKVVFQRTINDAKAFKLPAGIKYDHVSIEVSGQGVITDVRVAETMKGLSQV